MRKTLCVMMLTVVLLFCCATNEAAALTKQEQYSAALSELKAYMNDIGNMTIEQLYDVFNSLGSYEYSTELAMYTRVLKNIDDSNFSQNDTLISLLQMNEAFVAFVQEDGELGTVKELDWYAKGLQAEMAGDKTAAIGYYQKSIPFMDSFQRMSDLQMGMQEYYDLAQQNLADGRKRAAFYNFLRAGDYKDALIQARMCGDDILFHNQWDCAAITSNGEIINSKVASSFAYNGVSFDVSEWKNIDHLAMSSTSIIAVDENGKTYVTGSDVNNKFPIAEIDKWKTFYCYESALTGTEYVVVRTDGTVVAYNNNDSALLTYGKPWKNIVDVKMNAELLVGLTKSGELIASNRAGVLQEERFADWKEIKTISAGISTIGGVRNDGTVMISRSLLSLRDDLTIEFTGYDSGNPEVLSWSDVAAIEVNDWDVIVGLKKDGTVVVADNEGSKLSDFDEREVSQWKDIVAITVSDAAIVGMKRDGTLVISILIAFRDNELYAESLSIISTWDLLTE